LRVKLSDPALVDDLVDFLRRSGCVAQPAEEAVFAVSIPKALREDVAEQLDLYLRVWEATHAQARGTRLRRRVEGVGFRRTRGILRRGPLRPGAWRGEAALTDSLRTSRSRTRRTSGGRNTGGHGAPAS
jgi:hypothetical protein